MLEVSELSCVRGERTLFRDVGFMLDAGSLLRVTGPNGSGKTSLLRIVCGLSPPAAGEVRWRGENIRSLREEYWKELVYVGHLNALKDDLTALENLGIAAALGGRKLVDGAALEALERFGVAACAGLPARVLSQGQRRRVALARLMVSRDAPLWVLDEPFTALDAAAVRLMEDLIGGHLARGGSVIYTTHQEAKIEASMVLNIELGAPPSQSSPLEREGIFA
jgi:heme exporter protein A